MPVSRRVPLLGGLCLAGCSLLGPVEEHVTAAVLDGLPPDVPRAGRGPETLLVYRPEAPARIDTRQMAYSLRPHHFAYFARNEWAESPARMLQPLLVRTLEATGRFAGVVTPPASGAQYGLHTQLAELLVDFAVEPPVLRLALRLRLVDERASRALGVHEVDTREGMRKKTPYAGVVAANAAVARALRETAGFVLGAAAERAQSIGGFEASRRPLAGPARGPHSAGIESASTTPRRGPDEPPHHQPPAHHLP